CVIWTTIQPAGPVVKLFFVSSRLELHDQPRTRFIEGSAVRTQRPHASEMSTVMTDGEVVSAPAAAPPPSKNVGSQTLDRGIRALEMVAAAPGGMTVQEVADRLEVHRTIAHRLLATLAEHHLIARGPDNRFRAGGGLIALAAGLQSTLRATAIDRKSVV